MNTFGYALFLSFYTKLNAYIDAIFLKFMTSFGGFASAFMVLYIVIVGVCMIYNKGPIKTKDDLIEFGISIIISVAILQGMTDNFSVYKNWVILPVVKTTTQLSGFFISNINSDFTTGSGIKLLFESLDSLSYSLFDFINSYDPPGASWATNAWGYMQAGVLLIALIVSYSGAYIVFLVLLILGYFSLYVLFTVGGICIFLAPFKKTRFIFFSWLRALMNYALVIVFTAIIMSICYYGLNKELTELVALKGSGSIFTSQYLAALCWSILTFGVLLKGPDYAAALSGGQAGSTSGIAGGIGMVVGAGASVLGLNALTGGAGKTGLANSGLIQSGFSGLKKGARQAQNSAGRAYSAMKGINN